MKFNTLHESTVSTINAEINFLISQSKWKKDGRTLTKSIKYNLSPAGSLFISKVNELDAGRYECTVTNEQGRATASCVVSVRYVLLDSQKGEFSGENMFTCLSVCLSLNLQRFHEKRKEISSSEKILNCYATLRLLKLFLNSKLLQDDCFKSYKEIFNLFSMFSRSRDFFNCR